MKDLKDENLAIYPSNYNTSISEGGTINWANVNFQPIGVVAGKRVWQLQGSGFINKKNVIIIYTINTPYDIGFEGAVSGVITTSSQTNALNAYAITTAKTLFSDHDTIIQLQIKTDKSLQYFGFNVFVNDNWFSCLFCTVCCNNGKYCCDSGQTCCNGTCCDSGQTCCNGTCCPAGTCCNGTCCPAGTACCDGQVCCGDRYTCCNGSCCKSDQTCCDGQVCCNGGYKCQNGACVYVG